MRARENTWEYLGIPGNTWERLGTPGNTWENSLSHSQSFSVFLSHSQPSLFTSGFYALSIHLLFEPTLVQKLLFDSEEQLMQNKVGLMNQYNCHICSHLFVALRKYLQEKRAIAMLLAYFSDIRHLF